MDNEFRRVPLGAIGELYLAGNQIADGYLNKDDETSKLFLNNPFNSEDDYNVMYRTGDMVRLLSDGSLAIVGRLDGQVKIRGNRVELLDVESVIRNIDCIVDVTVQTIKNGTNNELVAYVVISEDMDDENINEFICNFIEERKPEYMVPSYVVKLENIPLTVNGKVDKRALPEVDMSSLHAEYIAPTTENEKIIVDAFEVVFNQNNIGLNDDFIRLGGDSIMAIRVISLLRENNITCTARDILNYKTPYLIARNVKVDSERVSYSSVEGIVDLLPIQKYFFDQVKLDNYTQEFILRVNGNLDLDLLQNAFNELTNIHDMLRAVYYFDDGKPIQEIRSLNTFVCEIKEQYIEDDLNMGMFNILRESVRTIDMSNHLVDINLIHYNDCSYVSFIIHHLIIDGVSWNNLLSDLTYIYLKLELNEEIDLIRPYPYINWVEDVKSLVESIDDEEKQHWIEINNLLDDSNIKGNSSTFVFNVDVDYDVNNLLMLSEEEYWALAIARAYKKTYGKDII